MTTRMVELPEELLELLARTKLGECDEAARVRIALAAFLFQQGAVSTGRATELSGLGRNDFELLLGEMGIPTLRYDVEDYRQDIEAIEQAKEHTRQRQQRMECDSV